MTAHATPVRTELEQFLYYEAWLLDRRKYEEWLELYTEDAVYWVPNLREDGDPHEDGVIIYEHKRELEARVARLFHPQAFTQEPPPRMRHLLTNVRIHEAEGTDSVLDCNFAVFSSRGGQQSQFVGSYDMVLTPHGNTWRIRRKKIFLINNDQPIDTLPIL